MYSWEKSLKDRRNRHEKQNPSFSSTLLDKIYRSIDEVEPSGAELKLRRETTVKKQSRSTEEDEVLSLRQACLLDKWMEQNAKEKISLRHFSSELDKKSSMLDHDYDHHFFSSGSNSSESSSGGLSSSDTESFYNPKPSKSCFSGLKPIRVGSEKPERRSRTLSHDFNSAPKSKSRVLRMYGNLKNLKQPISPGGRLASFVNSIFTGNAKKPSTCSSASSFSRSCLGNNSQPCTQKLRNGDKRSVQFCPVSLINDKDLRPRKEEFKLMSASVPSSWNVSRNKDDAELKLSRPVELATDFLKQIQNKTSGCDRFDESEHEEEEDDDDASCASSDLFELDHLAVKYRDELPVYETTRVDRNRAISNGLCV